MEGAWGGGSITIQKWKLLGIWEILECILNDMQTCMGG